MILSGTGVSFETHPANIDEGKIKKKCLADKKSPGEIGMQLAREKAFRISKKFPGSLVIGADQILEFNGKIFDKPKTMAEARETLKKLRGKTHRLISCVALAFGGKIKADFREEARLTMKDFSDEFLETYLEEAGPAILSSVGAYQLEGLGNILFEDIEGDFFTILGLPRNRLLATLEKIGQGKIK